MKPNGILHRDWEPAEKATYLHVNTCLKIRVFLYLYGCEYTHMVGLLVYTY